MPLNRPPVLSSKLFPCSGCHAGMEAGPRRSLSFHEEISIQGHGEPRRWCLDCHDAADRDSLRLAGGERVPFSRSHLLCSQCHGSVFRSWKTGIHGKRTGMWDGPKHYFLCPSCHNPHSPRFKPLVPLSRPLKPAETLRR